MKTLWCIRYTDYDVDDVIAVFTEKIYAEAHKAELEKLRQNKNKLSIDEIEIDPPLPVIRNMARGTLFEESEQIYGKAEFVIFYGGIELENVNVEEIIRYTGYYNKALSIRIEAETEEEAKERGEMIRKCIIEAGAWGDDESTRIILAWKILK